MLRDGCLGKACLSVCSLSLNWCSERGAWGRLVCLCVVCLLVLLEGYQGKACLSVCSLSLNWCSERGAWGRLVCLCVVCLLVLLEGYQGKACLSVCSLSPGAPRGVPGEGLSSGAPRGVPGEGLSVCVWSVSWCSERGAWGRLVCLLVL